MSKLGVDHMTRTLALEYAPSQIRVNAVSPGVTDTPIWRTVDLERGMYLGMKPGELTVKMVEAIR